MLNNNKGVAGQWVQGLQGFSVRVSLTKQILEPFFYNQLKNKNNLWSLGDPKKVKLI
jgi:hypothetical protein